MPTGNEKSCVIQCNTGTNLTLGYTKVKVHPNNYSDVVMIAGVTGKTIQDVVDELLSFAIRNTRIMKQDGSLIDINLGGSNT